MSGNGPKTKTGRTGKWKPRLNSGSDVIYKRKKDIPVQDDGVDKDDNTELNAEVLESNPNTNQISDESDDEDADGSENFPAADVQYEETAECRCTRVICGMG